MKYHLRSKLNVKHRPTQKATKLAQPWIDTVETAYLRESGAVLDTAQVRQLRKDWNELVRQTGMKP